MFQQRRQASLGNINLGNLSAPPSFEDLSFLLEQAMRYRGRFVEVSWAVAKTGATFQLTAKIVPNQPLPVWMLYRGVAGNSQLVWGHNSNDLTLMHNLVMLECERPVEGGGNSISANAMDSLVSNNRTAGSIAGPQTDQQAAMTPQAPAATLAQTAASNAQVSASAATAANVEPAGASGATSNPSATWLQNLSYGQSPAAAAAPEANQQPHALQPHPTGVGATESGADVQIDLSLDGSLSNISVPNLIRYIVNNRLSGRLAVQCSVGAGEVFFHIGTVKHAATLDSKGENALYELATWHEGSFHFYGDEQTAQSTVTAESELIIEGCRQIGEYFRALLQAGLHPASYLVRGKELNRGQFERAIQGGLPVDVHTQFRIYEAVQGNLTFAEILRACPLVRAEWIPLVYNLLNCGVIGISDRPAFARPGMYLEGEPQDKLAIEAFLASVSEPDGFLSTGAFAYFLQQEFFRHERTGSRFALALFTIAKTNLLDGRLEPISSDAFGEAAGRIMQAKRKLDLVGHFDESNCGMLLPETDAAGAAVFANRIAQFLKKPALSADMEGQVLVLSFGIASIPDDARDLETLIAAARVAKNKSKMMGAPVILYSAQ